MLASPGFLLRALATASVLVGSGAAFPLVSSRSESSPTVTLDGATVTGVSSNSGNASFFLGIPFAQPPVGDLRFRLPQPIEAYNGSINASTYGLSCPQQTLEEPDLSALSPEQSAIAQAALGVGSDPLEQGEDCLTINVIKPSDAEADAQLPVVVWIYGGGFELGATVTYNGTAIVERSVALGEPVIYVSMNYRVTGFGFLASQEVKDAGVGNLGLQDQREALRWVQKYISQFGGDPTKVTIWGESAGSISVSLQMLANDGDNEGLFRGAFMQSGSPIPAGDITKGQRYYDQLVNSTGCTGEDDTLECLRGVPYEELKAAIDATPNIYSYQSLLLAWLPRADGIFLSGNPQQLLVDGKVANVPFVNGDCEDEGTIFSLSNLNVTTDAAYEAYLNFTFLAGVPEEDKQAIFRLYPNTTSEGSPYDTEEENAPTPEYKRLASIQGDAIFQAPRRLFLHTLADRQDAWSYDYKRGKSTPLIGAAHGSDIVDIYSGGDLTDYLLNFVNHLDPNGQSLNASTIEWPKYTNETAELLTFQDGEVPLNITKDDFRVEAMQKLGEVLLKYPV